MKSKSVLAAAYLFPVAMSQAGEWTYSTELGVEGRWFVQDARLSMQQEGLGLSVMVEPEVRYQSEDRNWQFALVPFARYDADDSERTHTDLREGYLRHIGDEWEITVGVDKVFWGVAESRHLVDVINQTDLVEDIDQEDKLGQPMVAATTQQDWGAVSLYWLPYFRERTFPGSEGRLSTPLRVDANNAIYESSAEQWHQDFALRYSHYIGDWDIGAHYFKGTSREASLLINQTGTRLLPYYQQIDQIGLDLQYTIDAWLWKMEAIGRKGQGKTFFATVAGFEYTFYQIADGDTDLGWLMEYQYDDRDESAPFTSADNDIFVGVRWSLNDVDDTAVLAGVSVDHLTGEQFYNIEAETRFGDRVKAELRARFLTGSEIEEPSYFLERDDYLQLSVSYFF